MAEGEKTGKTRLDRLTVWGFYLGIASIVLAIIGLVVSKEFRDTVTHLARSYGYPFLAVLAVTFVGALFYRTLRLGKAEAKIGELTLANAKLTADCQDLTAESDKAAAQGQGEPTRRWETYDHISFGHLRYPPFLDYDPADEPAGLGVALLKELLEIQAEGKTPKLHSYRHKGNWTTIFDGLVNKEYDVVATPLFATFTRSKEVRFTSPLFYSNVGLYVSKSVAALSVWKTLHFNNLPSCIGYAGLEADPPGKLELLSVKGEISEKLAGKYGKEAVVQIMESTVTLSELFSQIPKSTDHHRALFCESFYAAHQPSVRSGEVVNVLPFRILYPVCFAVRKGDYHLTNLLNIRLLDYTRKGGTHSLLAERLPAASGLHPDEVKKHFVAEWPTSA